MTAYLPDLRRRAKAWDTAMDAEGVAAKTRSAGEIAKRLDPRGGDEIAADQPLPEEVGDPRRIVQVALRREHLRICIALASTR